MSRVIDLHDMDKITAKDVLITKYNEMIKDGNLLEIEVIHGYGSGAFDRKPVIREYIREYLRGKSNFVKMVITSNPGVTYLKPIKKLPIQTNKKKPKNKRFIVW